MNQITVPTGMPKISDSLAAAYDALGAAADALNQAVNSETDPVTGTGPTAAQTTLANQLQADAANYKALIGGFQNQGC